MLLSFVMERQQFDAEEVPDSSKIRDGIVKSLNSSGLRTGAGVSR